MRKRYLASLERLSEMVGDVKRVAMEMGFQGSSLNNIELAVEETLVNIICHGYPQGSGPVEISCETGPDKTLKIVVRDQAKPFNPTLAPLPLIEVPVKERRCGGYGILLILKTMDDVVYERQADENVLTLIKRLK